VLGDQLLTEIGARLAGAVRSHDTVGRIGGDEFAVVLERGPTKAANEGDTEALFCVTYVVPKGSPRIVFTDPPSCATGDQEADDDRDEDDGSSHGDD
jgi:GGDEF domain-containing protein